MVIQGSVRRLSGGLVIAMALAFALAMAKAAEAQHIPSLCSGLTPSDWEYWIRQCWMYPAFQMLWRLIGVI